MKTNQLTLYIPDTRGVVRSQYGMGNQKIGPTVFTYSRMPGLPTKLALGSDRGENYWGEGTCPGATEECQKICYAARPVTEGGLVAEMWYDNSITDEVPPIPDECKLLRIHVSGDFNTKDYILNWYRRIVDRPDITVWAYTRSWRVPELLPALELLRALPHVQLFASMDISTPELPPLGWRRAWIDGDPRAGVPMRIEAHSDSMVYHIKAFAVLHTEDGTKSLLCPEETKAIKNCEECGFCFDGKRNDVTFLKH